MNTYICEPFRTDVFEAADTGRGVEDAKLDPEKASKGQFTRHDDGAGVIERDIDRLGVL